MKELESKSEHLSSVSALNAFRQELTRFLFKGCGKRFVWDLLFRGVGGIGP